MSLYEIHLKNLEDLLNSKSPHIQENLKRDHYIQNDIITFAGIFKQNMLFSYTSHNYPLSKTKQHNYITLTFKSISKKKGYSSFLDFYVKKETRKNHKKDNIQTLIKRLIRILKCEIQSQKNFTNPLKILILKSLQNQGAETFKHFINTYHPERNIFLEKFSGKNKELVLTLRNPSIYESSEYYGLHQNASLLKRVFRNYGYQEKGYHYLIRKNPAGDNNNLTISRNKSWKMLQIPPLYKNFHELNTLLRDNQNLLIKKLTKP